MNDVRDQLVLGGAQVGGLFRTTPEEEAWETLERAWNAGVRRFDTAPHYGAGLSERRLGPCLRAGAVAELVGGLGVARQMVGQA